MHLKIITHDKIVFDEDVEEIYTRGTEGEFGVLKDHIPMMAALDVGVTRAVQKDKTRFFTTMGGVFQLKDSQATILTQCAECGLDIDVTRAKESLKRAEARLAEQNAEIDISRAEAAVARALARIKAANER